MAHIPDDDNFEEYMNASAEEWSKPEAPPPLPEKGRKKVDRWGSPIPAESANRNANRWGSEPLETSRAADNPQKAKSGSRWWIIAIVIVVMVCVCLCLGILALSAMGVALPFGGFGLYELFQ